MKNEPYGAGSQLDSLSLPGIRSEYAMSVRRRAAQFRDWYCLLRQGLIPLFEIKLLHYSTMLEVDICV